MAQYQSSRMNENLRTTIYQNGSQGETAKETHNVHPPLSPQVFRQAKKIHDILASSDSDLQQNIEKCSVRQRNSQRTFIVSNLTTNILTLFKAVDPDYSYDSSWNPKRILTKPSQGTKNHNFDNENSDYILCVGDFIGTENTNKYRIIEMLGQGTFGQVVKCQYLGTGQTVAVKIIKNEQAYFNQSLMEVTILDLLNNHYDPYDQSHITRMLDNFIFRGHLCIVFELLSINLYELLKQNKHQGFSHSLIRKLLVQIIDALCLLKEAKLIHCDLKPENILLKSIDSPEIKIIDFGSGCHENKTIYTYIQSRFYRSPEVLLGLPYTSAIDMWSFGCIAMELFLGMPVFPGNSNYDQIKRIVETLGMPPSVVLEVGKDVKKYFVRQENPKRYSLKSRELFEREFNVTIGESKRYVSGISIDEMVNLYPMSRRKSPLEVECEKNNRASFIDFVKGILNLNPLERWTPHQARRHPYLTGEPFTAPFNPISLMDFPITGYPNAYSINPHLPNSIVRNGRSRAMTINSMKPQVPIPTSLERVADIAGSVPATIPVIGERHYSIVADPNCAAEIDESLLTLNRPPVSQRSSLYPQSAAYHPYAAMPAVPSIYGHPANAMLPLANGILVGSTSDHSLGFPDAQPSNILSQRRISNPFGYNSKYQPSTNYHPYPMEIHSFDHVPQIQMAVNPVLAQQQHPLPNSVLPYPDTSLGQQQTIITAANHPHEGNPYPLDGYNATRRDSIPQDRHFHTRQSSHRKNAK